LFAVLVVEILEKNGPKRKDSQFGGEEEEEDEETQIRGQ
jgi:hypothetical protein